MTLKSNKLASTAIGIKYTNNSYLQKVIII